MCQSLAQENIRQSGVIGVVRVQKVEDLARIVEALHAGGLYNHEYPGST